MVSDCFVIISVLSIWWGSITSCALCADYVCTENYDYKICRIDTKSNVISNEDDMKECYPVIEEEISCDTNSNESYGSFDDCSG